LNWSKGGANYNCFLKDSVPRKRKKQKDVLRDFTIEFEDCKDTIITIIF